MDKSAAFKQLVALAKGARKQRDQLLILTGGVLGLDTTGLRSLTLSAAREALRARQSPYAERVLGLVEDYATRQGIGPDSYLFASERHRGRLERTVVWRIINGAGRKVFGPETAGAIRLLQQIAKDIEGTP